MRQRRPHDAVALAHDGAEGAHVVHPEAAVEVVVDEHRRLPILLVRRGEVGVEEARGCRRASDSMRVGVGSRVPAGDVVAVGDGAVGVGERVGDEVGLGA